MHTHGGRVLLPNSSRHAANHNLRLWKKRSWRRTPLGCLQQGRGQKGARSRPARKLPLGPDALDHARWACTLNDWDYVHPHAYTRVSAALDLHYADAPHDTPIHYDRTHRLYRPQNTLSALKSVRRRKFKFSAHEWYSHCDTCKFNLNSQTITFSLSSEDSKQLKEEQDRIISKLILKLQLFSRSNRSRWAMMHRCSKVQIRQRAATLQIETCTHTYTHTHTAMRIDHSNRLPIQCIRQPIPFFTSL